MAETGDTTKAQPPVKLTWEAFHALVKGAERGEKGALPKLRRALDSDDYSAWSRWFVSSYGDPPTWLKNALIHAAGGEENGAVAEAADRRMDQLRKELEGPDPSPMERLLVERAVYCWFAVHYYEAIFTQNRDLTLRQAEYHQRKIDRAHGRFLSALRTLAQVRKMGLPTVQVNIGENQVNVAGS